MFGESQRGLFAYLQKLSRDIRSNIFAWKRVVGEKLANEHAPERKQRLKLSAQCQHKGSHESVHGT